MKRKSTCRNEGYTYKVQKCFRESNLHKSIINRILPYKRNSSRRKKNLQNLYINKVPKHNMKEEGPSIYSIYCIVNMGYFMNRGNIAASVARGFLGLYNKADKNKVSAVALDEWEDSGEKLVVLKGIDHKHLRYLSDEMQYGAVSSHVLYQTWGCNKIILVLAALGKEEDLDDILEGLTYLQ